MSFSTLCIHSYAYNVGIKMVMAKKEIFAVGYAVIKLQLLIFIFSARSVINTNVNLDVANAKSRNRR